MKGREYKGEHDLIQGLIKQDQHAINMFVERFQNSVFRICLGFIHNREDSEEVAQDVLVEAIKKIDAFRGDSSLATWLYRICYTRSMNKLKQKSWLKWITCFDDIIGFREDTCSDEENEKTNKNSRALHKGIDQLPEKQRIAFVLSKYEELSYKEIAEIMDTSIPAVESLLFRAKQNLMKNLKKE